MSSIDIPISSLGPGSQPLEEDGAELQYMSMPKDMTLYSPPMLPEAEEVTELTAALDCLTQLQKVLSGHKGSDPAVTLSLNDMDAANRDLINQALGEGEVSVLYKGERQARIQESRLAGVWRVQRLNDAGELVQDDIEVADIPSIARQAAFKDAVTTLALEDKVPDGVLNAPPLIVELSDKAQQWKHGDEAHVINLTLLPQTEQDLDYLGMRLGIGPITILSRGYGNCRVTATGLNQVWWVQHFNSDDKLILNTLEVSDVPYAALAAREDMEDSAERLAEMLDTLV